MHHYDLRGLNAPYEPNLLAQTQVHVGYAPGQQHYGVLTAEWRASS